jgi:CheY-like chemotaxis protein
MAGQMLQRLGYRVTIRTSSVEALALFQNRPGDFDLLITDMTMPNMTGDKLAAKVLATRPDLPIIICTGFSENISEEKAKAMGIRAFVMKPLIKKEMALAIRNVLDGNSLLA